MNIKEKYRLILTLALVILVGLTALQSFASDGQTNPFVQRYLPDQQSDGSPKISAEVDFLSPQAANRFWAMGASPLKIPPTPSQQQLGACQQMIVNSELDVIDLGDGTGTVEPWAIIDPIVYFDSSTSTSPIYSLVLDIGDASDPTPTQDAFGQAFFMPDNLISVDIDYNRKMDFANPVDEVYGNLWTVDNSGNLETFITSWPVADTPAGWAPQNVLINDAPTLNQIEGRLMALLFFNTTTDPTPGEIIWFDDVTLTACFDPPAHAAFLPVVENNAGTGPLCIPPTENPPDSWFNDRGLIQTGAVCNTNLSVPLDDRDYYSYVASQTGSHTIRLRNLPSGSNWAALVYNDTDPPPAGPTNGGTCFTSAPGDGDKSVVCTFNAGQKYVIKVSSGSTPMNGSYILEVTMP